MLTSLDLKPYYVSAAIIYKWWLAHGFEKHHSLGLLAQADAESSLSPNAIGDHYEAFGLHQWHEVRAKAIKHGCGIDLMRVPLPPLEKQLEAALWELHNTEKSALAHILEAKDAYDAGYAACRYWERPASTLEYLKRGDRAEKWGMYFAKNPV